jgi:predicted CoA-binding protein
MAFENPSREQIKELLQQTRTIAVVGLSDNPEKTSHTVSQAMQEKGYRIIPVNPNAERVLGEKSYASLLDLDEPVDIVNVFRRSEQIMPIAEEVVKMKHKPKAFWLQLGIVNEEAARLVAEHGIQVIMDRCIKVEDSILLPNRTMK